MRDQNLRVMHAVHVKSTSLPLIQRKNNRNAITCAYLYSNSFFIMQTGGILLFPGCRRTRVLQGQVKPAFHALQSNSGHSIMFYASCKESVEAHLFCEAVRKRRELLQFAKYKISY